MKKLFCLLMALAMMLTAGSVFTEAVPETEALFTPGTYEAEAQGLMSVVKVWITVDESEIVSVLIDATEETETLGGVAAGKLAAAIRDAQTPNVDTISGATVTSNAVIKAATEALEAAGADIAVLDANRRDKGGEDKVKEDKVIDTEIVIIGAGGAGMTAAIMTKQAGKDFVLLEKMSYAGGNTTKATGGMNAAETHYQKEQGIEDSVELFVADTIKGGHDLNDPELVQVMASESAGAIDWLDSIGADLPKISFSGGASVNRIHAPADGSGVGEYLVEKFSAKLAELGVDIMYETKATELLVDADGKICGVKAESPDYNYTFNCKAVILATGGFGANEDMYTQYRPDLKGTVTTNAPGATGDGIVMAQALGADLVDIEQIQLHPTVEQSTSMLITESVRGDGAILVNQSGVRFTNELLTRDAVSAAELAQEGCYAYIIFDQNLRDHLKAVEKYVKTGITVQADTIEGLAEQLDIDPATLAKTLADWNECVKNQNDPEFGRTTGMEADLKTPPYYAIKIAPGIHHTMGGVKIDTSAHVINTEGKAIPGLYAAGEVTGGVHGGNRLGGNAVADIVIFGRIAAATAIAELDGVPVEEPKEEAEGKTETETEPETTAEPEATAETKVTGTATVMGYGGDVTVTVTLEDGKIIAVEMTGDGETPGIGRKIIDEWPQVFVESDGILDTYTGATFAGVTRQAVIEATRNALADAGVNPDDYIREAAAGEEIAELIIEADIVIAGAGGAGMTAALTAADAGKSVLVLESQPAVGGNSVKSTGGMNASKTVFQDKNEFGESAGVEKTLAAAENYADNEAITALAATVKEQWEAWQAAPEGYFDSPELFALDTLIGGKGLNDPELVNTLVNNSAAAIDWLSTVGIDLNNVAAFGGASVKRIHRPVNDEGKVVSVGAYTIPRLEQACSERNNLALMTDVTVTRILTDDSGAVCGVEAVGKAGNPITVKAKAVIIATGGFGANLEMVASYAPQLEGFMTTNAAGIQGQGILMATELGAATVDMDQIQIHPTVQADTASLITEGLRGDGAILINANGERFIDEVGTRDVVSAAEIAQPGSFSWLVVDQKMVDASSVIQGYISRGLMISGETYEELANNLGIPADTFAATMAAWNGYVADKNDPDFGRTSFASPLDTAPYYAVKVTAGIHHTMGGLKIDTETHVLKENGEIIPGLYAAGEVTGGVHGANRLGGNAVADFVVFGRIAGETAVKELDDTAVPETAQEPTAGKNDNVKTVTKQGYDNGDVIITVTIGDGNTVESLEIDANSQTPGLGQKAMEEDFIRQFIGKTGPFAYGDGIDAITSATLTSNAVLEAINEALGVEAPAEAMAN